MMMKVRVGMQFWMKPCAGTKDASQCFDVASENAVTAMGYDTGQVFALSLTIRAQVKYGDDFVVSGTRNTTP